MSFAGAVAPRLTAVVVAGLTMVACAGQGPGGHSASVAVAPTGSDASALASYALRYGAIVAPVDAAFETFQSGSGALPAEASVDSLVIIIRPFAAVIAGVDAQLSQVRWPAAAVREIKAQRAADRSLTADLLSTTDVTLILSVWRDQIVAAARKVIRAERAVSIDLGLVPPSGR
jgi:hypothetical protein